MTSVESNHISYTTKSRYYTLGEPKDGKKLLIALHGYGYLARYFIRKFNALDTDRYVIVCPEAPHRFYQAGTNGRVGASWMTKEDRLTDIDNYIAYLDALLNDLKSTCNYEDIILLGFSQGGATASRWIAYGKHKFDKFLLWATVFPPDMEQKYTSAFNQSKNYFVFGTKDEYYTEESIHEHFQELGDKNIQFEMRKFDGNHNIDEETLLSILNE